MSSTATSQGSGWRAHLPAGIAIGPQALRWSRIDAEYLATTALLVAVLILGLVTVGDYGITVDEFNANDYGPKALAWYTSGFHDRSTFDAVEDTLWYYGPWFQIVTTLAQSSFHWLDPWKIRHALTFLFGLAGLAALLPIGRLAFGRWAGFTAIVLCLTTGYLYGSLYATPIDIPFLFAMTWATWAIVAMASVCSGKVDAGFPTRTCANAKEAERLPIPSIGRRSSAVPSWPATVAAGILTGLAIATRSSGVITHVYLLGAMLLCMLDAIVRPVGSLQRHLVRIAVRFACAAVLAWVVTFALWPWLQIGNPIAQFGAAFAYFAHHPNSFEVMLWGAAVQTTNLPWYYVPGQLVARLPESFLLLLAAGLLAALAAAMVFLRRLRVLLVRGDAAMLAGAALLIARARPALIVWAAAVLPAAFVMAAHSTLYDGIRHMMFLIPMLALVAGSGALHLAPLARLFPRAAVALGASLVALSVWTLAILHPLEYVATNVLTGGVAGAYGRFDLDYWSMAATVALRRLEQRIDTEDPGRFSRSPPSITVCIGYRAAAVAPMFGRPWRLETDPKRADFLIATERWPCADGIADAVLIDEITRFGRPFAWTYARKDRR